MSTEIGNKVWKSYTVYITLDYETEVEMLVDADVDEPHGDLRDEILDEAYNLMLDASEWEFDVDTGRELEANEITDYMKEQAVLVNR